MKASCALHTGQYFIVIFCGNNEELVGLVLSHLRTGGRYYYLYLMCETTLGVVIDPLLSVQKYSQS